MNLTHQFQEYLLKGGLHGLDIDYLSIIFLFLGAYLVADSPFNLVTKLSSGAAGGWDALYGIVLYAALAVPLFIYAGRMREKKWLLNIGMERYIS